MKTFAIDTSTNTATAAIVDNGNVIGSFTVCLDKPHSQKIMPIAEMLFNQTGLKPENIDLYSAAEGPGSFTGIRIGIAAVLGFSDAVEKECVGVSTLDAFNFPYEKYDCLVCPLLDARRNRAYFSLYKGDKVIIHPDCKPIDEIAEILRDYNDKIIITGDFVPGHRDLINDLMGNFSLLENNSRCISNAVNVAMLAERIYRNGNYKKIMPKYVLKSYVEELEK